MTMGLTEAVKHVNTTKYLESFFIYIGDNDSLHTLKSKGFEGLIQE